MSQFLLDRQLVASQLLKNKESASEILKIFTKVLSIVQASHSSKQEDPTLITVTSPNSKPFTLHKLIVAGIVQLVSFTEIETQLESPVFAALYSQLVKMFFPPEGTSFFQQNTPINVLTTSQAFRLASSKVKEKKKTFFPF